MTIDRDRVAQFSVYLTTLEAAEAGAVMRDIGGAVTNKFSGVMLIGRVRNPAEIGSLLNSVLTNLDPADQLTAGMALLRVVSALMGSWFASPEMADAPGINKINTQFSKIVTQIARLDSMLTNPGIEPLIDPLPPGSIVQAAAETIAGLDEDEGLAMVEAIAMAHTQKYPGSILINEPTNGEDAIAVVMGILQKLSPNVFGFAAMNLIGILARCMDECLRSADNQAPVDGRADAIAVMNQISRTMAALGDRTNQIAS